jgi:predicted TIM-barrel fold metal-dependent hydrolase
MAIKWLIIDAQIHWQPPAVVDNEGEGGSKRIAAFPGGEQNIAYRRLQDIDLTVRTLEEAGVDMLLLNQTTLSPGGLETCKRINDGYAHALQRYPGKLIMCGHIPLNVNRDVIDEIERCISELGFKGMSLISSMPDITLDSPELRPIYEKISQLNVPIVVHPTVRYPLWGGGPKYELRKTISREYEIAKAVVEVMYGVLKDFPDLKFLMPHYGGGMPALKARIRAYFEPDGWSVPAEIRKMEKTPRELDELGLSKAFDDLFDKLYFDMAGAGGGWLPMIESALPTIRADRLCFGTDYPWAIRCAEDISNFIDNIKQLDIPETNKKLMLGENIKRLFKL